MTAAAPKNPRFIDPPLEMIIDATKVLNFRLKGESSGAALAALHREHIGFSGLVKALKPAVRIPFIVISEVCILGFFALLAWVGFQVLVVLKGDNLISLPQIPTRLTQSVIPIGAILFIIAEALGIPELLKKAARPDGFANIDIPGETEPKSDSAATEVPRP